MAGTASAGVVSCTPGGNDVFSATLRTRVSYVNGSLGFSRPFPRNIQANPGRCSSSHSLYCPGSLLGWLILTKNDETPRSLPAGCGLKLYVAWERYGRPPLWLNDHGCRPSLSLQLATLPSRQMRRQGRQTEPSPRTWSIVRNGYGERHTPARRHHAGARPGHALAHSHRPCAPGSSSYPLNTRCLVYRRILSIGVQ